MASCGTYLDFISSNSSVECTWGVHTDMRAELQMSVEEGFATDRKAVYRSLHACGQREVLQMLWQVGGWPWFCAIGSEAHVVVMRWIMSSDLT